MGYVPVSIFPFSRQCSLSDKYSGRKDRVLVAVLEKKRGNSLFSIYGLDA